MSADALAAAFPTADVVTDPVTPGSVLVFTGAREFVDEPDNVKALQAAVADAAGHSDFVMLFLAPGATVETLSREQWEAIAARAAENATHGLRVGLPTEDT